MEISSFRVYVLGRCLPVLISATQKPDLCAERHGLGTGTSKMMALGYHRLHRDIPPSAEIDNARPD
jgi:hypothetical protein